MRINACYRLGNLKGTLIVLNPFHFLMCYYFALSKEWTNGAVEDVYGLSEMFSSLPGSPILVK